MQARRRLPLEEAGLGRKAEPDEETEFDTTPACASVWIYMRMWHFRAPAILRFTSDSTHHKPEEERVENHTARVNVVWPGTFPVRDRRLANNAPAFRDSPFVVLGAVLGELLYVGSWRHISVNFQINVTAIPCGKLLWMDSFFLRYPPDEGHSEEHTDWGHHRQSCWMWESYQMSLCFHCCCTFISRWLPSVR